MGAPYTLVILVIIPRPPMDVLWVPSLEDFPHLVISTSLKNSLQRGCLNLTEIVNSAILKKCISHKLNKNTMLPIIKNEFPRLLSLSPYLILTILEASLSQGPRHHLCQAGILSPLFGWMGKWRISELILVMVIYSLLLCNE